MNGQGDNSITLNDNYTNYDFLDIYYAQSNFGGMAYHVMRIPANTTDIITLDMMYRAKGDMNEEYVSQRGIAFGIRNSNQLYTLSNRSFTLDIRIDDTFDGKVHYNGPDGIQYGTGNYPSIAIFRVDGIKEH